MKAKYEYNNKEYLDELWVDVCRKVYKMKEIDFAMDNILKHEAEQAWEGTNYTERSLAEIASKIVEDEFGEKEMPKDFKNGLDYLDKDGTLQKPIRWTRIKCSQCQSQVYFDLIQFRHRCNKCGHGF